MNINKNSINKILEEVFKNFEDLVDEPTLKKLNSFIQHSHEYIDARLSYNQDKQVLKKELSTLLGKLYSNSIHIENTAQLVGQSLRKKNKFDKNMEYYQRRVLSRNNSRKHRPIKEFSDKQKLNIFLNYLSKVLSTTEFETSDRERFKITLKRLDFDADTFNGLGIKSAMPETYENGISKFTFYINRFFKIFEDREDREYREEGKWQNQRWYTKLEVEERLKSEPRGHEKMVDIQCRGFMSSLSLQIMFEQILGLCSPNEKSIFDIVGDLTKDTHNEFRNAFVLDGLHSGNALKWEEIIIPNSEHVLMRQKNLKALVIESSGQRGKQFLTEETHIWRDVFIFSEELTTFRSLTDDITFNPSINIPPLSGGWRISNNMPEIPAQFMKEFIYYFMDRVISKSQRELTNSNIEIGSIDSYLEFHDIKEVARRLELPEIGVKHLQEGKLPLRRTVFDD